MEQAYYIGIMSGTSVDSVDVVLCRIDAQACLLEASYAHPFPQALKEEIVEMIASSCTLSQTGVLDHRLGLLFAEAVDRLLAQEGRRAEEIRAIGSHGQTLWHQPEGEYPFTMQLGDPTIIAAHTGIPVVADLRRMDMAYGGSGAPIAPAFHRFIFKNIENGVAVVNIGGIANITLLDDPVIGYDTGPGNMLMDAWCMKHLGKSYDRDGAWASEGRVNYTLLERMLDDPYFAQKPPKSTGREYFNMAWLHSLLNAQRSTLNASDVQRTLLELTTQSISNEVLRHYPDILMLCGGGAKNSLLVERIAALMPNIEVGIMEHGDWIEAMMMAWMAYKRIEEEPVVLKDVTGARKDAVLGALYIA